MQPFLRIAPASFVLRKAANWRSALARLPGLHLRCPIAGSGSSSATGLIEQRLFSQIIAGRLAPPYDDGKG
jgi:hypothetical protein